MIPQIQLGGKLFIGVSVDLGSNLLPVVLDLQETQLLSIQVLFQRMITILPVAVLMLYSFSIQLIFYDRL